VFVVPALLLLVARTLNVSREKLTSSTRFNPMTGFALLAVVVVALSGLSYSNATTRVKGMAPGFQQLEPAGKWFRGKNVSVLSTSPRQEMFYSRNSADFEIVAANNTKMVRQLRSGKYDYFVIDAYERTRIDQVKYVQRNLMNTSLLRPVKAFRQNGRPVVLVFRVNAPA
ncbi:MAG: hypothetical protein SV186_04990, partial [Candidatus Nanohaloarchaea archaeon]|nr:hypothetical protein [Candidatus Nanohaloarchaea archaeon]